MDLNQALAAAVITGIMPFPGLVNKVKKDKTLIISLKNTANVNGEKLS